MPKYNAIGRNYNETRKADDYLVSRILNLLDRKKNDKILDIGCGTGNYTIELFDKGLNILGVEPSELMLNVAKEKKPNIDWFLGNAEKLLFEDGSFDKILTTLTIHHFENLETAFKEIFRVLKSGGTLLVFTSTSEQMKNYWLNHYFPEMMKKSIVQMPSFKIIKETLEKTGFENIETEKYFVQDDLQDKFLYIGKNNPKIYFDENIRKGISSFADLANEDEIKKGLDKLKIDIETNKFSEIKNQYSEDLGDYLFIKIYKKN